MRFDGLLGVGKTRKMVFPIDPVTPPTRIISGYAEWFHTVAGYGDVYRISVEYGEDIILWTVSNEYGIHLHNPEYALNVLKNFICQHIPNQHSELKQIQPHLFTQKLFSVILPKEVPYPMK